MKMKRLTAVVSIVCLVALCFTLFAACGGNIDKVTEYVEKINKAEDFIMIYQVGDEKSKSIYTEEYEYSGDKAHVVKKDIPNKDEADAPAMTNANLAYYEAKFGEDIYYEIVDDKVRVYSQFACTKHKKGNNDYAIEWKQEIVDVIPVSAIGDLKTFNKGNIALFNVDKDKLEYSKDAKGFVYKSGVEAPIGAKDVVINAKFGELSIKFTNADGLPCMIAFRNMDTARVSFPIVCKDFEIKK